MPLLFANPKDRFSWVEAHIRSIAYSILTAAYVQTLQTNFIMEAKNMNPDQTVPFLEHSPDQTAHLGAKYCLIWVHSHAWIQKVFPEGVQLRRFLLFFCQGREDPNSTKIRPLSARQ